MSEIHLDSAYDATAEARFHGTVTDQLSWVANFNATINAPTMAAPGSVGILDLIAQYKAAPEFNIWAGRLLVPSDRSNFSGPFFSLPWNYPGFYFLGSPPLGPRTGPTGRDQGVTVWGNALEDKLKYYAGAYGIGGTTAASQDSKAYGSGRISYTLQGAEPGYFGSSTYYGAKNVVTIGVGGQYQKSAAVDPASGAPTDAITFMADALAEENVAGVGTLTFEGQFYNFTKGYAFGATAADGTPVLAPGEAFYLLAAYMTPNKIGPGKIQPLLRVQHTLDPQGPNASPWTIVDAALAYVIKDYSGRVVLTYQHIDLGSQGGSQNALQLGIQLQSL
jgi:hypothetical protein